MIYRFNRLFNVSKTRALVIAVLCFIAGCCVIPLGIALASDPAGAFASVYIFIPSLIYGSIWYYKFNRDKKVIARLQADTNQKQEITPSMSSPDSYRLFVPGRRREM